MPSTTIKDVAHLAGVSTATVSYVINNGPRPVTETTKERVLAAMKELNYEPNASARRLRNQHNYIIGIALAGLSGDPGIADLYFLDILRGISVTADLADYNLMIFSNHQKLGDFDFYRKLAAQHMIDGLIASGSSINTLGLAHLNQVGLPAINVGRQYRDIDVPRVSYDFEEDAYQTTKGLLEMGHRRIALFTNVTMLFGELERVQGYQRALAEFDIPYDPALVHIANKLILYPSFEVIREMYIAQSPTAFISAPYREIAESLDQLEAPPEVVVATLDEEYHVPRPKRVAIGIRLPKYEAGKKAVEMVLQHIQTESCSSEEVTFPSQIYFYGKRPPSLI